MDPVRNIVFPDMKTNGIVHGVLGGLIFGSETGERVRGPAAAQCLDTLVAQHRGARGGVPGRATGRRTSSAALTY